LLIPYRSLSDPEIQGEGSIDPLGLATIANHLGDWILPGMTARMWRPRFLTAIAVTATIVEPFNEQLAQDGVSPSWLVVEWYYVEAMTGIRQENAGSLRRIPGIDKARQALHDQVPMNATRYLKTPKVFGFHGIYKRLARHTDIVNDDLALGENGHRLVRTWEKEQALSGFSSREIMEGESAKLRRTLRDAVKDALASGQGERQGRWSGGEFFTGRLAPHRTGRQEAGLLWELLTAESAEPRGEIFRLLREPDVRRQLRDEESERRLLARLRPRASEGLNGRIAAIEAYESVCRPLQEAWDRIRLLSSHRRPAVIAVDDVAKDARFSEIAAGLASAIQGASEILTGSPISREFETLVQGFDHVSSSPDLLRTIWDHHVKNQQRKPPDGKRPWFEETESGGLLVRPPYRLDEAPPREEYVHPYRLFSVASFTDDLYGEGGN
jgi:hypothetical protein